MSFGAPLVLLGLLLLPALAVLYSEHQRRRAEARRAFVAEVLADSPIGRRPTWRRHVPMLIMGLALAVLILAAARPQRSTAVPITAATIVLANDISDSMDATDVHPSRLRAAQAAATRFIDGLPATVRVGSVAFARHPVVLQSPTTDHALARRAIAGLRTGGGGTAIGDAINLALQAIRQVPKINGKRPPGAIVLLSDGAANVGADPLQAARQAKAQHVAIDTIALGTQSGTIVGRLHGRVQTIPVPVSPQELAQIAAASGGRMFAATDSATASAIYARLATTLGHRHVKRPVTASFAGAGLALLVLSGALTLFWFARLT